MLLPSLFNFVLSAEGATTGTFDLTTIMSSAVDSVKADVLGVLAIVVPAIVIVVGAVVGVRFGIKWLRSIGKG